MNTNYSDETLCAFLDGELSPADMAAVRAQLQRQPDLAERLARLSAVDELVRAQASRIDAEPMPASVLALLQAQPQVKPATDNVVQLPQRSRWQRLGVPLALAASLVVAIGVWRGGDEETATLAYADALDHAPSGSEASVGDGTFVANFSYRNHDGRWCRQFRWRTGAQQSDGVACRDGKQWELVHSVQVVAGQADNYQPATRSGALDAWLDADMEGAALDAAREAELRQNGWR